MRFAEAISYEELTELIVPCSRSLIKYVDSFLKETDMVGHLRMFEAFGLSHEGFFFKAPL